MSNAAEVVMTVLEAVAAGKAGPAEACFLSGFIAAALMDGGDIEGARELMQFPERLQERGITQ